MYNSKLASMIQEAVNDCIQYGIGHVKDYGKTCVIVSADWAMNETDIEITVTENGIIRFTFTEEIPEEYR